MKDENKEAMRRIYVKVRRLKKPGSSITHYKTESIKHY